MRKGDKMSSEMRQALVLAHVSGEASRTSESEMNRRLELETNFEMLHDTPVEEMLTDMMYDKLYWTDPNEKDAANPLGKVHVARGELNYDMAALRMMWSQVNRASFLSPKEAGVIKIKIRNIMRRIKLQSRPDEYSLGKVNFLKAIEIHLYILLNDAIEGRKAKLLKMSSKGTTLNVEGQGVTNK